eukprot:GHVL01026836.1.p1 GENE.GHVL01026836.1~~GHVL01026836.1.p1  ORF type:complete len:494 (+),score=65.14 GHVL01026836.1:112-1593(+)
MHRRYGHTEQSGSNDSQESEASVADDNDESAVIGLSMLDLEEGNDSIETFPFQWMSASYRKSHWTVVARIIWWLFCPGHLTCCSVMQQICLISFLFCLILNSLHIGLWSFGKQEWSPLSNLILSASSSVSPRWSAENTIKDAMSSSNTTQSDSGVVDVSSSFNNQIAAAQGNPPPPVLRQDIIPYDQLVPTYESIKGLELVWQAPLDYKGDALLKGVVLVAHGCHHEATSFWPMHETRCPRCSGLPENTRVIQALLHRGYLAIAASSLDRSTEHKCWRPGDVQPVKEALEEFINRESLQGVPLYAIGFASGGYFAARLAHILLVDDPPSDLPPFSALVVAFMAISDSWIIPGYSPTLFMHMPKDKRTAVKVTQNLRWFQHADISTKVVPIQRLRLYPEYFYHRIALFPQALSKQIYETLASESFLTADGYLRQDPKTSDWQDVLATRVVELHRHDSLREQDSGIYQELNRAWAFSEVCADNTDVIMDWFDTHT